LHILFVVLLFAAILFEQPGQRQSSAPALVDPPMRNAAAGLFVPLDIVPDTSQRFSWRGLLGGIAILATIPVVLWLISLLEAAFSN